METIQEAVNDIRAAGAGSCLRSRVVDSSRLEWFKRLFMACAREECEGFVVDDFNWDVVRDIFGWCMMLDGRLDPYKGLWLWGNIGTGKSTMLRIVKRFARIVRPHNGEGNPYSFLIISAQDICGDFSSEGYAGLERYIRSRRLAIDELGREPLESGHYGNTVNVMRMVLQSRYDLRHTHFTHVTTNLTLQAITRNYGEHIFDRCREMFNMVEMTGATFRTRKRINY